MRLTKLKTRRNTKYQVSGSNLVTAAIARNYLSNVEVSGDEARWREARVSLFNTVGNTDLSATQTRKLVEAISEAVEDEERRSKLMTKRERNKRTHTHTHTHKKKRQMDQECFWKLSDKQRK